MNAVKRISPGYILLDKYELKSKVGAWRVFGGEGDDAPELGRVLDVGLPLPEKKMPFEYDQLPVAGEIMAYKKYNNYKFAIGSKELYVVPFDAFLFTLTEEDKNEQN